MTRRQWQFLIPAGMLSLALLAGVAQAEDKGIKQEGETSIASTSSTETPKKKSTKKRKSRKKKAAAPVQTPS